jgi:hypothetical protein
VIPGPAEIVRRRHTVEIISRGAGLLLIIYGGLWLLGLVADWIYSGVVYADPVFEIMYPIGLCATGAVFVMLSRSMARLLVPIPGADQCPHCGYRTADLKEARCPECGLRLDGDARAAPPPAGLAPGIRARWVVHVVLRAGVVWFVITGLMELAQWYIVKNSFVVLTGQDTPPEAGLWSFAGGLGRLAVAGILLVVQQSIVDWIVRPPPPGAPGGPARNPDPPAPNDPAGPAA